MNEHSIGRRRVLRGAGAAVAGGAAVASVGLASSVEAAGGPNRIAGSWMIRRHDEGDPTEYRTVLSFAVGGVLISNDILPTAPGLTGAWERREGARFVGVLWGGFPGEEEGDPGVLIRVRVRGQVDHDTISGSYRFAVLDPDGTELETGTGTFRGRRIDL